MPIEDVPMVQKRCIELARDAAKPVIVATQMLDSMITNSRPTRAEATDCANAVLDGADALMLSGETSVGDFAIESVETMARIIERTEEQGLDRIRPLTHAPRTKGGAVTKAAAEVGDVLGAKYLVTFTQTGDSARRISRLRSHIPILAITPEIGTYNRLALSWGIESIVSPMVKHTDDMVMQTDKLIIESKRAVIGDQVMIVAGAPPGIPGSTNAMRVHRVGDAVNGAAPAYK
jgi:pyruvate kinase